MARTEQASARRPLPAEGFSFLHLGAMARPLPSGRNIIAISPLDRFIAELPVFDGFPYLIIRVVPAMYHITVLPEDASERDLVGIARAQCLANLLDVCLVIGPERALYINNAAGLDRWDGTPPRGGALITGQLRPPTTLADTPHLRARRGRLNVRTQKAGFQLGDLTKGGRAASADEVARLAGAGPEGMPRGLECCPTCGEWRGTCLDPSRRFFCTVMTVHCRCANDNRCAACGQLLYERKLNANYYNPRDRQIWHVPGFCGLGHRCPATPAVSAISLERGEL